MDEWQLALVVLLAIFIGALIPVTIMIMLTLQSVRKQLLSTGTRVDELLDRSSETVDRVNRLTRGMEGGEAQIAHLMTAVGELSNTVHKLNASVNIAAAIGNAVSPAVAAFVGTFMEARHGEEQPQSAHPKNGREKGGGHEGASRE